MKKKIKIVIAIMIMSGLILVSFGTFYMLANYKEQKDNKLESPLPTTSLEIPVEIFKPEIDRPKEPSENSDEKIIITKEQALKSIKDIYEIENLIITFKEEIENIYIFEQKK